MLNYILGCLSGYLFSGLIVVAMSERRRHLFHWRDLLYWHIYLGVPLVVVLWPIIVLNYVFDDAYVDQQFRKKQKAKEQT